MIAAWCVGAGASDPGPRDANEDSYLSAGPVHVVADGMGGHLAGAAASRAAVDAFAPLTEWSTEHPTGPSTEHGAVRPEDVAAAIVWAQEGVERLAERLGGPSGTTLTGAIAVEHEGQPWWMVINVGDSRVYALDGGALAQITTDHSYVQELVMRGEITPQEAAVHPESNIVTRAIGDGVRDFDAWLVRALPGRRLVIASDGLTKAVPDERIASIAAMAGGPETAALRLVEAALDHRTSDNVTAVVADTLHAHTSPEADPAPWPEWGGADDDDTTLTGRRRESV